MPTFGVVDFKSYIGPPGHPHNPTYVPISPVTRGGRTKIPLQMAWAFTIHKAQELLCKRQQ